MSTTIAAPTAHSPPVPMLASARNSISHQMLGARAQAAVPIAYNSIVKVSTRTRPMRSPSGPNSRPPAAQPTSSSEVRMPVQTSVALRAADDPIVSPSSVGTQLGVT